MMLHVTHVDDSVRGRQEPCVYVWGVTHHLSLLMKTYITATQKKLESRSPPLNVNELNIYQLYCVLVNKEWLRARVLQPELSPLGTIEVFCIDTGETHLTPLCFLRNVDISGIEADHIRKSPPLAQKFILADMLKPRLPDFDSEWTKPALNFLKAHLKDQSWEAVPLSNYAGVQIVRLYDATNQLFVSRMIEQRLGVPSQTYQEALCMGKTLNKQPIPDSTTVIELLPTLNTSPVTVTEIPDVDLAAHEILFVVFSGEPGSFFGKLDKISLKDQDEMATELYNVYSSLPNPPFLYSHDNTSRLGHYGVLQSHGDQNYNYHSFRRVLVISELSEDVRVYFIDYGNSFWISRFKILAPLECLKNFRQPPHGIHCKLEEISLEVSKWESSILDKWVKVRLGVCAERIHMVTLTEDSLNEELGLLDKTETPPSFYDYSLTTSANVTISKDSRSNLDDDDGEDEYLQLQVSDLEVADLLNFYGENGGEGCFGLKPSPVHHPPSRSSSSSSLSSLQESDNETIGTKRKNKRSERTRNRRRFQRENRRRENLQLRFNDGESLGDQLKDATETIFKDLLESVVEELLNEIVPLEIALETDVGNCSGSLSDISLNESKKDKKNSKRL